MHSKPFGMMLGGRQGYSDAQVEKALSLAAAAGAQFIRLDARWKSPDGTAVFENDPDLYLSRGLDLLPILTGWPGDLGIELRELADAGSARAEVALRRWGDFIYRTVSEYKDRINCWEIWNEPNAAPFMNPPRPGIYARLLKTAYIRAREADPDCTIVGVCMAGMWLNYLKELFETGAADYLDAFSFHPYRYDQGSPEEGLSAGGARLTADIGYVRELLRRHGRGDVPVWITEVGYSTATTDRGISEREQADYLVRLHLLAFAAGVERVVVYCMLRENWKDLPWDIEWQNNMGLLRADMTPKPACGAYAAMTAAMKEVSAVEPLISGGDIRAVLLQGRSPAAAAWTLRGRRTVETADGKTVLIDETPKFIRGCSAIAPRRQSPEGDSLKAGPEAAGLPQLLCPFTPPGEPLAEDALVSSFNYLRSCLPTDYRVGLAARYDERELHLRLSLADGNAPALQESESAFDGISVRTIREAVEIFIDPDDADDSFHQFILGFDGSVTAMTCDLRGLPLEELDWDNYKGCIFGKEIALRGEATREDGGWVLQLKIPFQLLGASPGNGSVWRVNFGLTEADGHSSSWSRLDRLSFHQPARFGRLLFV